MSKKNDKTKKKLSTLTNVIYKQGRTGIPRDTENIPLTTLHQYSHASVDLTNKL